MLFTDALGGAMLSRGPAPLIYGISMTATQTRPEVRNVTPDGQVVAVALQGIRGRGREVQLDRDVWDNVSSRFGSSWVLDREDGFRSPIRVLQGNGAGKLCPDPIILGAYVTGAARGKEVVPHRDRDALNLTRANLHVLPLDQWLRWGMPVPRVPQRKRAS